MVVKWLDWITREALPAFFSEINSWMIADGVSLLGFLIAVTILCIGIGAILFRV